MSRRISKNIQNVVNNRLQTQGNRAKLTSIVEIKRPYTVLKDDYFLEKLEIDTGMHTITDIDIGVSHPRLAHPNDSIYISAISDGMARVYMAKSSYLMKDHRFIDMGYTIPATKVSIGFEAVLEPNYRFDQERVTSNNPWLFYISPDGSLNGLDLNTNETVIISSENAIDVSVVSGPWHWSNDFDYGMMVFFISNEILMCRRLIKGKWYNAEVVSFGPGGPYIGVTATLTWDYRVAVNVYKSNDESHTIFTNFLGFGKFMTEVVDAGTTVINKATLTGIEYLSNTHTDRVNIYSKLDIDANLIYKGPSVPIKVHNIKSTNVEWGRVLIVEYNLPIVSSGFNVENAFSLEDSRGKKAVFQSGKWLSDGRIELTFDGFNDHIGTNVLSFNPGVTKNEFGYNCEPWTFSFDPLNLNGNSVPYLFEKVIIDSEVTVDATLIPMEYLKSECSDSIHLSIMSDHSAVLTNISDL